MVNCRRSQEMSNRRTKERKEVVVVVFARSFAVSGLSGRAVRFHFWTYVESKYCSFDDPNCQQSPLPKIVFFRDKKSRLLSTCSAAYAKIADKKNTGASRRYQLEPSLLLPHKLTMLTS